MGRPKNDGSPTAQARIEEAFFAVLETTPFEKITISAIVKSAHVHRNSFYYYFGDLNDLARSAVANLLLPDLPALLASGIAPRSEQFGEAFHRAAVTNGNLRKLAAVTGKHSTAHLRNTLKVSLIELWCDVFGIDPAQVSPVVMKTVNIAIGGMLEMFTSLDPREDMLAELAAARQLPIVQAMASILVDTLTIESAKARLS